MNLDIEDAELSIGTCASQDFGLLESRPGRVVRTCAACFCYKQRVLHVTFHDLFEEPRVQYHPPALKKRALLAVGRKVQSSIIVELSIGLV